MSDGFEPVGADLNEMASIDDLLAAARAPGRPDELYGEDAALAAFRSAVGSGPEARRRRARRLVAVKVGAVAGALAIAATAVATTTGVIPLAPPSPVESAHARPDPTTRPPQPGTSTGPAPNANRPQPRGLCRAYLAHLKAHPGSQPAKAAHADSFRALSAAAGGDDRVLAYCTDLVATDKTGRGRPPTTAAKR